MEVLIEQFVNASYNYGYGYGEGSGEGYYHNAGYGFGEGSGKGDGYGDGFGYGYSSGYCDSDGCGFGYIGASGGTGKGDGYGGGSGESNDYGAGYGLKSYNGDKIYCINSISTIIRSVRGNIAKGFILNSDLTLTPCFIVKENNVFSHGSTVREAFSSLQKKLSEKVSGKKQINRYGKTNEERT